MIKKFLAPIRMFFHYGETLHPARDWFVIISISAIILGVSVGWNSVTFLELTRTETPLEAVTAISSSNTAVKDARVLFYSRAAEEEKYKSGTYRFVDPSQIGG